MGQAHAVAAFRLLPFSTCDRPAEGVIGLLKPTAEAVKPAQ